MKNEKDKWEEFKDLPETYETNDNLVPTKFLEKNIRNGGFIGRRLLRVLRYVPLE